MIPFCESLLISFTQTLSCCVPGLGLRDAATAAMRKVAFRLGTPEVELIAGLARFRNASSITSPRNPRHFNVIEGGRKRVSTTFMDKNSVPRA